MPVAQKEALLVEVALGGAAHVGPQLMRRFRAAHARADDTTAHARRNAAELLDAAHRHRTGRIERERRVRAAAQQERRLAAEEQRAAHLDKVATAPGPLWEEIDNLIGQKKPAAYDRAVTLLTDLRDAAARTPQASADYHRRTRGTALSPRRTALSPRPGPADERNPRSRRSRRAFDTPYGLVSKRIATDGVDIFIDHGLGDLRRARDGQAPIHEVVADYLRYLTWAADDEFPSSLRLRQYPQTVPVVIGPRFGHGLPVVAVNRVPVNAVIDLWEAGESVENIAYEYEMSPADVDALCQAVVRLAA